MMATRLALFFLIFSLVLYVFNITGLVGVDVGGKEITKQIEQQKQSAEDTGGITDVLKEIPFVGDLIIALKKLGVLLDLFKAIFTVVYNTIIAIFGNSTEVIAIALAIQSLIDFIYILGIIQFLTNRNVEG
jgi:hypothetical protein